MQVFFFRRRLQRFDEPLRKRRDMMSRRVGERGIDRWLIGLPLEAAPNRRRRRLSRRHVGLDHPQWHALALRHDEALHVGHVDFHQLCGVVSLRRFVAGPALQWRQTREILRRIHGQAAFQEHLELWEVIAAGGKSVVQSVMLTKTHVKERGRIVMSLKLMHPPQACKSTSGLTIRELPRELTVLRSQVVSAFSASSRCFSSGKLKLL
jgi:hypothetical protein